MADTKISGLAAAASVATTTVVPVVRSGASVTEKATLSQIAGIVSTDATAFTQAGTSAVARSITSKLQDTVSIWDFGVVGDGTTDDTAAWAAALATGKNVHDPRGGSYKTTSGLTLSTVGQRIIGAGRYKTVFKPTGSFSAFTLSATSVGMEEFQVNGASHTGGDTFHLSGASNSRIANVLGSAMYNMLYVEDCNTVEFENVWAGANQGSYSVKYYGDGLLLAGTRSDILNLKNVICSGGTDKPVGLLWDGNAHTVYMTNVAFLLGHSYAIRVRNTSGGTAPSFLRGHTVELEYCERGLYVEAGSDIEITSLYSFGHTVGDGVNVAASLGAGVVKLANSRCSSNAGYGVFAGSNSSVYVANLVALGNTTAQTSGTVLCEAPGFRLDANCYLQILSSNPVLAFDANDSIAYDRAGNSLNVSIGGVGVEATTGSAKTINVPVTATSFAVDSTAKLQISAGIVVMGYDTNDHRGFTRSSNTETLTINSVAVETTTDTKKVINVPVLMPGYAFASLPSAVTFDGCAIRITDRNNRLAMSDGTNWVWAGQSTAVAVT